MKWPPGWKRKGVKRRGEPEYKHMMKKRGRVRKDVTLMRQMNKSDTGEAKLPGNVQKKWRRKGMGAINAQRAMEK